MVTIRMRAYLSSHHIAAAAHFTRKAKEIEADYDAEHGQHGLFVLHRGYVMGAVLSSVAFLEAAVNELFVDAVDEHGGEIQRLAADTRIRLAQLWRFGADRASMLNKFQLALATATGQAFDEGRRPFGVVRLLDQLRDRLVHYQPESLIAGVEQPEQAHKVEKQLRGKFALNPLMGRGNLFWPDKCLSYGCAKWAVQSSIAFADDFFSRLDLTPNYAVTVRDLLDVE